PGRRHVVVDPPADILLPGLAPVAPPRVLLGTRVEPPKRVDIAEMVERVRQPRALLRREARILLVAAPIPDVDVLMRHVPVAAKEHFPPRPPELHEAIARAA